MNNWFLYLIRCRNGRLYTGITTDVERRFEEHRSGKKKGSKYLRYEKEGWKQEYGAED